MTSRFSGWLPTAGRTCSLLQIFFFLLLAICPSLSLCLQQYPSSIVSFYTQHIHHSVCVCDNTVLSGEKCTLDLFLNFLIPRLPALLPIFPLTLLPFFLLMFPSVLALSPLCRLFLMPPLSIYLFVYLSLLFLPRALLSKQSGLYQDEPQPKQGKQKIRARKSARRRGRILSCQPLCASLPTADAPLLPSPPHPHTHTHTKFWFSAPPASTRTHAWHSVKDST